MTLTRTVREDTRGAILEAARERFLRFGARKTTMEEVAQAAGCSRATVYLHFRTKEALYAALLKRDHAAFLREAETALTALPDAPRKLRRMIEIARATYARNTVLRHAMAGDEEMTLGRVARDATREQEGRIIALIRTVLQEGVAEGSLRAIDPERTAYLMFHFNQVLILREITGTADYPFEEILDIVDDVLARGVAASGCRTRRTDSPA